ncbi:MAG: fructosamine kinase family protein [Gemmatimonadetes bacterium]|nr:fructosamine kinase family protein [Gemmatimonadota bacterium]
MDVLPSPVRQGVTDALSHLGATSIRQVVPAGGGCINNGARVDTDDRSYFLKWNPRAPEGLFEAEADGLRALAAPGKLRVPAPLANGGGSDGPRWLLMEYVAQGSRAPDFDELLGRGLAALHRSGARRGALGWHRDNWIGSLDQSNRESSSWACFWRDQRIAPQLQRARERGHLAGRGGQILDRVLDVIPAALADVDDAPPHLLHGDLWGGNVYAGPGGEPVVIDPAVYRGHGEVDLAMTELFGGFGPGFYDAYDGTVGITPAYHAYRRELYQLYYLLVHVNLFGASYEGSTVRAAGRVLSEVS